MDSTNQGNTRNILLTGPWSIPCPLHHDELLSSWLVRAALANGCDPLTLTGDIWTDWRPWTLDIDRGLPNEKLKALAKKCKTTPDKFDSIALHHIARRVAGNKPPAKQSWPWVLAIGTRNRLRTGGLQYCPYCLEESPYFRIHWRLAWHCCCALHNVPLRACCQKCSMPIEPHRLEAFHRSITVCPNCLSDFSKATGGTASERALAFQNMADHALSDGYYTYGDVTLPAPAWFELAKFFYTLANRMINLETQSIKSLACHFGVENMPRHSPQLEKADTETRANRFAVVASLLNTERVKLTSILKEHGISQQAFCPKGITIPECLLCVLENLENRPLPKKLNRNKTLTFPLPRPWHEVQRRSIRIRRKLLESN